MTTFTIPVRDCGHGPKCGRHPQDRTVRLCKACSEMAYAQRDIAQIAAQSAGWAASHQQLLCAIRQYGDTLAKDALAIRAFAAVRVVLPEGLEVTPAGLHQLEATIRLDVTLPISPAVRRWAACAVRRAAIALFQNAAVDGYTLPPMNDLADLSPPDAPALLRGLIEDELPPLRFAHESIIQIRYALKRFFFWLMRQHPELTGVSQITMGHLQAYLFQGTSSPSPSAKRSRRGDSDDMLRPSARRMFGDAWRQLVLYARSRPGARYADLPFLPKMYTQRARRPRNRVVVASPTDLIARLDAFSTHCYDRDFTPLDRLLAHLLVYAPARRDQLVEAEIPDTTVDGVRLATRCLLRSRRIVYPPVRQTRRLTRDYRREASDRLYIPLQEDARYLELYAEVDRFRRQLLKDGDSPLVFLGQTHPRRAQLGVRMNPRTLSRRLAKIATAIGYPGLDLVVIRNSMGLHLAKKTGGSATVVSNLTGLSPDQTVGWIDSNFTPTADQIWTPEA
jgi:hypothetical protein